MSTSKVATIAKDRLKRLVADLRMLLSKERKATEDLLRAKHLIGTRLIEEQKVLKHGEILDMIKAAAAQLDRSWVDLYESKRFCEKFPDIDAFFDAVFEVKPFASEGDQTSKVLRKGSELSWRQIVHELLYDEREGEAASQELSCSVQSDDCFGKRESYVFCFNHAGKVQAWLAEQKASKSPQ